MKTTGGMRLLALLSVAGILGGCVATSPLVMGEHFQRKVMIPCDNDQFCHPRSYSVAWDTRCVRQEGKDEAVACYQANHPADFPVSYRSREQVVEADSEGYRVMLPDGGAVRLQ